jgi:protoheme IX farnesyltransferase
MLTKPRIISLLLVITFVPMFLAGDGPPSGWLILWTMVGGFLAAGGANAINQYVDRDIDHVMVRTRKRPLPGGRMSPTQVLIFGILPVRAEFCPALVAGEPADGGVGAGRLCSFTSLSTRLLKRTSTQNIVIGGAAGAVPPLVGWAAVSQRDRAAAGDHVPDRLLLDAAALLGAGADAAERVPAAGVPMLPVIAGERETHRQIVLYSVLLLLISVLPFFLQLLGPVYLVLALVLNGVFLWQAIDIWRKPTNANVWRLYKFSLLYLALLFLAMGVDHLFFTIPPTPNITCRRQ